MEDWRTIEGFEQYEVSDEGRVRNASTLRILGQYDNGKGYQQVVMQKDGKNVARAVHRLVANAYLGEEDRNHIPMHIDDDLSNNRAENLVWKPRWFATERRKQKRAQRPADYRPIRIRQTGEIFENSLECAKAIDGSESMILLSAKTSNVTYKGLNFEFIRN